MSVSQQSLERRPVYNSAVICHTASRHMLLEQIAAEGHRGFVHLCEGTRVHRGSLDVQHHSVYQRFGPSHKANPQAEMRNTPRQ